MSDENSNQFKWITTKNIGDEKSEIMLTGKVKDHTEYNGICQTELTYCKVMEGALK